MIAFTCWLPRYHALMTFLGSSIGVGKVSAAAAASLSPSPRGSLPARTWVIISWNISQAYMRSLFFFFSKWVLGFLALGRFLLTRSSCLPDGSFGFSTARLVGLQFENRAFLFWNVMMWALENVPLMIVTKTLMHFVLLSTREKKKKTKIKKKKMTKKKTKTNIKTKVPMMLATKTLMHFVLSSLRKPASLSTCSTTENNFEIEPIFFFKCSNLFF